MVRSGNEKPGLIDSEGRLRDLSDHVADIDGSILSAASLGKLKELDENSLPKVDGSRRLGPCVGIGWQY